MSTTFVKEGGNLQLVWGSRGTLRHAPTSGGRQVAAWEEIDGVAAADWPDGVHVISDSYRETPEPMDSTLFLKEDGRLLILWDEVDPSEVGGIADDARTVDPDEVIEGRRAQDWPDGTHVVPPTYRLRK